MKGKPKVIVAGGGFGGLETAFYLRHTLKERMDLTLICDKEYFLFKPNTIYIPFGEGPEQFKVDLRRPASLKGIELLLTSVDGIDSAAAKVYAGGKPLAFDYLVIATGAAMRPEEVPGLKENALTLWTPDEMLALRRGLEALIEKARGGARERLVFLVPPNNKCSGPLYEIALMTDTWLRKKGVRDKVEITWTTFEEGYIQAFGPRLNTVVAQEFNERGIMGLKGVIVNAVEPGLVHFQGSERVAYDLLVSFPPYIAKETYAGLPADNRGFLAVDPDSRSVRGHETIYAVGDATDFPIKQAFLALLQGDAAGEHIASRIDGRAPKLKFEPMSMCVMEELNKATFAQVPLEYTGDPMKPVGVASDEMDRYKVGVSPLWRLGKKILGLYLPWRFGSGEPFHAGFAWDAMDMGLKVMSKLFAK
jgi:sulfide:quinone oxidoreductase